MRAVLVLLALLAATPSFARERWVTVRRVQVLVREPAAPDLRGSFFYAPGCNPLWRGAPGYGPCKRR